MTIKDLKDLLESTDYPDDTSIDEIIRDYYRGFQEDYDLRVEALEEHSLMNAYQQDLIDSIRYEK